MVVDVSNDAMLQTVVSGNSISAVTGISTASYALGTEPNVLIEGIHAQREFPSELRLPVVASWRSPITANVRNNDDSQPRPGNYRRRQLRRRGGGTTFSMFPTRTWRGYRVLYSTDTAGVVIRGNSVQTT